MWVLLMTVMGSEDGSGLLSPGPRLPFEYDVTVDAKK